MLLSLIKKQIMAISLFFLITLPSVFSCDWEKVVDLSERKIYSPYKTLTKLKAARKLNEMLIDIQSGDTVSKRKKDEYKNVREMVDSFNDFTSKGKNQTVILNLRNNNLDDYFADLFSGCLKSNSNLLSLDLSNNKIGFFGAQALLSSMVDNRSFTFMVTPTHNTSLIYLNLEDNSIPQDKSSELLKMMKIVNQSRNLNSKPKFILKL